MAERADAAQPHAGRTAHRAARGAAASSPTSQQSQVLTRVRVAVAPWAVRAQGQAPQELPGHPHAPGRFHA